MDLLPDTEQEEIVGAANSLLADRFPFSTFGSLDAAERVVDDAVWAECAGVGWFGLGLSEDLGGVGYDLPEEALLFVELGATVAPGPHLATVLAARVLADSAHPAAASLVDGTARAGWAEANHAGVVLHHPAEVDWFVSCGSDRVEVWERDAFDDAQPFATVDSVTPMARASEPAGSAAATSTDPAVVERVPVLVAALAAGIARATAEQSTQYAKDREQFGVPIGSFQAVKHRCADMAVLAEAAITQVRFASLSVRDRRRGSRFEALAARRVGLDAAIANAQTNVQNHGGIGFTWEHSAHRYVTRARLLSHVGGAFAAAGAILEEPNSD